jgi:hypothetical protein
MTSPLPRSPRTTAPGTRPGTAASLAVAAALLAAGPAAAQPRPAARPGAPAPVLHFQKPAGGDQPRPTVPEKSADPKAPPPEAEPPVAQQIDPRLLRLPSRASIFTIPDDAALRREIIREVAETLRMRPDDPSMIPFPDYDPRDPLVPPGTRYVAKTGSYPPAVEYAEPAFVVHRRLHFEEKNAERYGWDLGIIQPFVSTAAFYKDVLLWPNSLASGCEVGFWDTSAGKCLPGTPVPYYLYPPGLTVTGVGATLGVYTAGSFIANPVGAGNALINNPIVR